jgi:O-Antigen ligase
VETNKADSASWATALLAALLALALIAAALNGGTYALIARTEASVLVWWILTLALAFGLLPRARFTKIMGISLLAWIGLAGWIVASLLWTESRERTVTELTRVLGFLGVMLAVGWTFTDQTWRAAAAALTGAAVVVCALALISRLAPDLLTSPLSTKPLLRRLSFPLNYWNALGCWAAMTVALALAWSAHAPWWPARGAALAGACVAASVAYLTYSRSATAGLAIAAAGVVALSRRRWLAAAHVAAAAAGTTLIVLAIRGEPAVARGTGGEGGTKVAIVAGLVIAASPLAALAMSRAGLERLRTPSRHTRTTLAVAAVIALFVGVGIGPALASRAWSSFQRPTPSLTGDPAERLATLGGTRRAIWGAALGAFEHHPLGGTGAGTFEYVWNRDPDRTSFVRDAHSLYLESLGELGLPGTLLLLTALGSLLVGAVRTALREPDAMGAGAGAGIAAALLVFCVCAGVDWMWESTAVTVMALAAGALATAARAGPTWPRGLTRRARSGAIAALALAVQLPVLAAAVQVRTSEQAARAGDIGKAVSSATAAMQIAPWEASGYLQRALLLERLGREADAAADARRATDREPTNWAPWLILARIEAERGHIDAALAAVRRAAALNPRAPLFRSQSPSRGARPRHP